MGPPNWLGLTVVLDSIYITSSRLYIVQNYFILLYNTILL